MRIMSTSHARNNVRIVHFRTVEQNLYVGRPRVIIVSENIVGLFCAFTGRAEVVEH